MSVYVIYLFESQKIWWVDEKGITSAAEWIYMDFKYDIKDGGREGGGDDVRQAENLYKT